MNTLFDESGGLNIDDFILEQDSFKKIMADGVVTDEEMAEQSQRVIALLKSFEKTASPEQIKQMRQLLAEISVLIAASSVYLKQKSKEEE